MRFLPGRPFRRRREAGSDTSYTLLVTDRNPENHALDQRKAARKRGDRKDGTGEGDDKPTRKSSRKTREPSFGLTENDRGAINWEKNGCKAFKRGMNMGGIAPSENTKKETAVRKGEKKCGYAVGGGRRTAP